MASNARLGKAKSAKNDEFYTRLDDIANELRHYEGHFKGKTVFCNCDDPYESNFFRYFVLKFNSLSLKKVIATSYEGSPIMGQQLSLFDITGKENDRKTPYKAIVTKVYDTTGDGGVDMLDVANLFKSGENELSELKGSGGFLAGDFRSDECIALLKEADIVSTNPPFSLFREYVAQLMEYEKKFVIIGNKNAVNYKNIFPLIKDNKMWVGATPMSRDLRFVSPQAHIDKLVESGRETSYVVKDGAYFTRSPSIWWTNLDHKKRNMPQILFRKYYGNEETYPKYDNYDAIHVAKTEDIPADYYGVMGVPISFLDKYNPEQFEIVGLSATADTMDKPVQLGEEFVAEYRRQGGTGHVSANMYGVCYYDKNGKAKVPYGRIFIRRKATNGD